MEWLDQESLKSLGSILTFVGSIASILALLLAERRRSKVAGGGLIALIGIGLLVKVGLPSDFWLLIINSLILSLLFGLVIWRVLQSKKKLNKHSQSLEDTVKDLQSEAENRANTLKWERSIPQLPLKSEPVEKLRLVVVDIHRRAYTYLQEAEPKLQGRQIRVNVFLGDCGRADEGVPCILKMHEELQVNMNHPPEYDLQFLPGQGATGLAFDEGRSKTARRKPTDEGEWDQIYQMTDELKRKVHKDVKWVGSFPLKDQHGNTLGVLNIDGLDYDFTDEKLGFMGRDLVSGEIAALGLALAQLPQTTIEIYTGG